MPVKTDSREAWFRMRVLTRQIRAAEKPVQHGTRYAYNRRENPCRCEECTEANRIYLRDRKANIPAIPPTVHGSENGYVQFRCRCEACKIASAAARRDRYNYNTGRKGPA
jgi:hypothetical protein